jgi:hypothetical protein
MGGEFDYRNNVIFNWSHRTMDGGDETSLMNVINNYYKPGPATNDNMRSTIARIEERNQYSPGRRFEPGNWFPTTGGRPGKWYVAGNVMEGSPEVTADNWLGMHSQSRGEASRDARVNTPFEGWPVNQQTAHEAFESVLAQAGATLPRRDAVDKRVTDMVRTGKTTTPDGVVTDPKQVGGYPKYAFDPAEVPADSDHDGMPDAWEQSNGLNPNDAADGPTDRDDDGYTNVEEFLNSTDPQEFVDYTNLGNNADTISG